MFIRISKFCWIILITLFLKIPAARYLVFPENKADELRTGNLRSLYQLRNMELKRSLKMLMLGKDTLGLIKKICLKFKANL